MGSERSKGWFFAQDRATHTGTRIAWSDAHEAANT
jgi:hypothetical protein